MKYEQYTIIFHGIISDMHIDRWKHARQLDELIEEYPVTALIGPRQVGKTTLAKQLARRWQGKTHYFDLESSDDLARLSDPMFTLSALKGLIVLDEIHRTPEIFPTIRVLADRSRDESVFLILGSASPALLKQSSETLAGRIAYYELPGLCYSEIDSEHRDRLWQRGGFPKSFIASSDPQSYRWRRNFVRTFLQRDIPQFGITIPEQTISRFWSMLANSHGQIWNGAELGRAFGISHTTVRRYLDLLESVFMVRSLKPWYANIRKRQVKSPKIYIRDSGLLHALLGLKTFDDLAGHPKIGASWEGHIVENLINALGVESDQCFFWATHNGAEVDLVIMDGGELRGFEIKRTSSPRITPSIRSAIENLQLSRVDVIHAGNDCFPLSDRVNAISASRLSESIDI